MNDSIQVLPLSSVSIKFCGVSFSLQAPLPFANSCYLAWFKSYFISSHMKRDWAEQGCYPIALSRIMDTGMETIIHSQTL